VGSARVVEKGCANPAWEQREARAVPNEISRGQNPPELSDDH
jgi:hypothetical protein